MAKDKSKQFFALSARVSQDVFDVIEVQSGLVGWTRSQLVEHIISDWVSRLDEHGGSIIYLPCYEELIKRAGRR